MNKFTSVHPVITAIRELGSKEFLVFEKMKIGTILFSFKYKVHIENNPDDCTVVMKAEIMKISTVEMIFCLKEIEAFTVVEENISFHSWLPVHGIMKRIFREQHLQLFKNIENAVEY